MSRPGRPLVQQQPQQRTILTGSSRVPNGKQILQAPQSTQHPQQPPLWGQTSIPSPNRVPNPFPTSAAGGNYSGSGSSSLDLSDFPALGSAVGSSSTNSGQTPIQPQGFAQVARNGNNSPAPPGLRPQTNQSSEPQEDFPALPGMGQKQQQQSQGMPTSTPIPLPANSTSTTTTTTTTTTSSGQPKDKQSDMDKYGMNGLLGVIRMENNDQTTVAIGNDLRNLGLNFNPTDEPLSKMFSSPWIETSKHRTIPEFKLPKCYEVSSAVPQQQKIQNLTEETLFYMFYTMPRDSMQEAAAVELTNRNWRYHKELKLWLTKDPLSEPVQQTAQAESGIYVFFDPSTWEKIKKEYVLYYPDIA